MWGGCGLNGKGGSLFFVGSVDDIIRFFPFDKDHYFDLQLQFFSFL